MTRAGGLLGGILLCIAGCTTVAQSYDQGKTYRHELQLEVNGIQGRGTLVLPEASSYRIKGKSAGRLDFLTLTTCHREFIAEQQGHSFEYEFKPSPPIEGQGACPLHISGYEQQKGRHVWAVIDFQGKEYQLPGKLFCDGAVVVAQGVSICQSRAGLEQRLEFGEETITATAEGEKAKECSVPNLSGQAWAWKTAKGECVYTFKGKSGRYHRLTTIGYDGIRVMED